MFTCVLALSTIGLWLSTRRLWRTRRTKPRQTSMSTWCFRLEFRMATAVSAGGQNAVQLRIGGIARPIELEPEITGTLEQADWFVCTSCGYASEQEARENGERLRAAFILAGARNYLGVDLGFGDYTFRFGQTISDEHRKSSGRELRGSIHGLDVFDRDKATVAVASKPRLRSPTRTEALQKNIQDAMNLCTNLSGRQEVCASLINDSFFVANQDVRFVMLVSAIEALCEQGPVTTSYHKLIEQLRRYLSGLEGVEREKNRVQSLLGENQKRVSVRQATRAKIETLLGPDKAEKFNEQFYGLRSDYLHDGTGRGEVGKHAHEVLQLLSNCWKLTYRRRVTPSAVTPIFLRLPRQRLKRRDLARLLMQSSMSCIPTNGLRKMSRNWCAACLNYFCQKSLSCGAGLPELLWPQRST